MQNKLDKCLSKWNQLWNSSHLYIERLKCVEIVLTGLEEATTVVSEFELKLASYEELPSEVDALQVVSFVLTGCQIVMLSASPPPPSQSSSSSIDFSPELVKPYSILLSFHECISCIATLSLASFQYPFICSSFCML
jgi:hypothetical protein